MAKSYNERIAETKVKIEQEQNRMKIPHECGMCGIADGVLCLSAQKETGLVAQS